MLRVSLLALPLAITGMESAAIAGPLDPVEVAPDVTLDPILNARIRLETVDQDGFADNASAITLRTRAGAKLDYRGFVMIAEGEATAALVDDYNDTIPSNGLEPFPVVADPDNLELNRLSIGYRDNGVALTLGRQRIIHDNARFLGNVGWRQNEQTFDAVRAQVTTGPVSFDASYANSQRTIFGNESPNEEFEGDLVLLRAGLDAKPFDIVTYAYLIDYDTRIAFSSETFGISASFKQGAGPLTLTAKANYASQSDLGQNPVPYDADYYLAEVGAGIGKFSVKLGYEVLGSDDGVQAFQTPLATAHAFNGWADLFLVTPATGLRDTYVSARTQIPSPVLKGLSAAITYHAFDSDFGATDYGTEIDAVVSFKLGDVGVLAKYANYQADLFGRDTERFWLQASVGF